MTKFISSGRICLTYIGHFIFLTIVRSRVAIIIIVLVLFLAIGQIFFNIISTLLKRDLVDFLVYYEAVEKFLQKSNPYVYLYGLTKPGIPFNYPPSALLILSPLYLLPIKIGQVLLSIISVCFFAMTLWIVKKLVKINISFIHFLILLIFFIQTFPTKFTLILGQVNFVVLGFSFLALYLFTHKKGIFYWFFVLLLFSLAAGIKILPLYTLPLFFIMGNFSFVVGVLIFFLFLNVIPSFSLFVYYYFSLIPSFVNIGYPSYYDQSLFAFFMRLTNNFHVAKYSSLIVLVVLCLLVFLWFIKQQKSVRNLTIVFSLIFAIFSIGNIFSWQHHLVFSFPLVFILYLQHVRRFVNWKNKITYWIIFLLIWIGFVFHFANENDQRILHPLFLSYQTVLLLLLIVWELYILYFHKDSIKRRVGNRYRR